MGLPRNSWPKIYNILTMQTMMSAEMPTMEIITPSTNWHIYTQLTKCLHTFKRHLRSLENTLLETLLNTVGVDFLLCLNWNST